MAASPLCGLSATRKHVYKHNGMRKLTFEAPDMEITVITSLDGKTTRFRRSWMRSAM
jgi:hypothetical protein